MDARARHEDRFPNPYSYAVRLVPKILEVTGPVDSIVDVGGGIGAWCKAFKESGATRVLCIDTPEIESSELLINGSEFYPCDLAATFPAPVRCELAICLEVAEHLPRSQSQGLVKFLTHSSDIVVFSASIPGQPGLGHINEHPPAFWRRQFKEFGFEQWDVIRPRIVFESDIPYWYRQNMFIYADQNWRDHLNAMSGTYSGIPEDFELVHKRVLDIYRSAPPEVGLGTLVRAFPSALKLTLSRRLFSNKKTKRY